ncbi:MAG: hypothetical protein R3A51_16930 [Nannocystaceae bacterium]
MNSRDRTDPQVVLEFLRRLLLRRSPAQAETIAALLEADRGDLIALTGALRSHGFIDAVEARLITGVARGYLTAPLSVLIPSDDEPTTPDDDAPAITRAQAASPNEATDRPAPSIERAPAPSGPADDDPPRVQGRRDRRPSTDHHLPDPAEAAEVDPADDDALDRPSQPAVVDPADDDALDRPSQPAEVDPADDDALDRLGHRASVDPAEVDPADDDALDRLGQRAPLDPVDDAPGRSTRAAPEGASAERDDAEEHVSSDISADPARDDGRAGADPSSEPGGAARLEADAKNEAAPPEEAAASRSSGARSRAPRPELPSILDPGEQLGAYLVDAPIFADPEAITYAAVHESGVAAWLHIARLELSPERADQWRRRSRILDRVRHPNVLSPVDHGLIGALPYVVTPVVAGVSLSDFVADHGEVPPHELAAIARDALAGLTAAARLGIRHGALCPDSVLLPDDARAAVLRNLRVVMPRYVDGEAAPEDAALLAYAAPEQLTPDEPLDHRCDMYGLGATLFYAAVQDAAVRRARRSRARAPASRPAADPGAGRQFPESLAA